MIWTDRMTEEASPTMTPEATTSAATMIGSHDGEGAGDHDVPFKFGRRPRAETPYPFSTRQYARLLVLRSRYQAELQFADETSR